MPAHHTTITTITIMTGLIAARRLGAVSSHAIVTSLPLPPLRAVAMFTPGVHLITIITIADTRKWLFLETMITSVLIAHPTITITTMGTGK